MNTLPKAYLLSRDMKHKTLFQRADRYHPDTARFVVLSESPCKENNFKPATVMARYIEGRYYGIMTEEALSVILEHTVWTESSVAEGPYRIVEEKTGRVYGVNQYDDFETATQHVNDLNTSAFGTSEYTVVNMYGIPVDSNGHLHF